jgi:hypothetical protein
LRRKESFSQLKFDKNDIEVRLMVEEIFNEILNDPDGDYIVKVQVLAVMKPAGW